MTKARTLANNALTAISTTELGFLDGVTSAIQTQIDGKTAKDTLTTTGDIYYASAANTPARLGIGTTSQVLTVASGIPSWATVSSGVTYVGAAAFRSTNLSVAKNTSVALTLPSEQYDTDGFHSTSTNTSRFTIPAGKAGKYLLTCFVSYSSAITEQAWLMLYINGSAATSAGLDNGRFQEFGGSSNTDAIAGSVSYTFAVGDYAEVYVFHNGTNTPLNLDSARVSFDYLGA